MTPVYSPVFRPANERYFLICASTCVTDNPPYCKGCQCIMPVKYSVVKDLDCLSNRLSGQAQRVVELVGLGGIEPPTSPLSGVRSSHLSYGPRCSSHCFCPTSGGAGRDRTGDLLNANQALSQLSYSPKNVIEASWMQRSRDQPMTASEKPSIPKWRSRACSSVSPCG